MFLKAVDRDPNFALAHGGIAASRYNEVANDFGDDPDEGLARGLAAGEHAVTLDDKDGFTHFVLGRMLYLAGQGDRAIAELEKSVALNPSFAHGYHGLGLALYWYGRAEDGIPMLDMAMRLSPHDPILWAMQAAKGACCTSLENYEKGVEWARKSVNARPDQHRVHILLAVALAGQDRLDEARVAVEAARRLKSDLSQSVVRRLLQHFNPEYLEKYIDALAKAGLPE